MLTRLGQCVPLDLASLSPRPVWGVLALCCANRPLPCHHSFHDTRCHTRCAEQQANNTPGGVRMPWAPLTVHCQGMGCSYSFYLFL